PLRNFLVDPFHSQLIRAGQLSAAEHFQPHGGGVYLNDSGRRLRLRAWSAFMAEPIQLGEAGSGTRWELLDQLDRSFAAAVDDPDRNLTVPLRR
ncbi:MAG: hypothetical protein ACKOZT_10960, partial [Cyanobium sp.]